MARLVQSCIHLSSGSVPAAYLRFTAFSAQLLIAAYWVIRLLWMQLNIGHGPRQQNVAECSLPLHHAVVRKHAWRIVAAWPSHLLSQELRTMVSAYVYADTRNSKSLNLRPTCQFKAAKASCSREFSHPHALSPQLLDAIHGLIRRFEQRIKTLAMNRAQ